MFFWGRKKEKKEEKKEDDSIERRRREYLEEQFKGLGHPMAFRRTTYEDAVKFNPKIPYKCLIAEVKAYDDWSDPKWKMGNENEDHYLDLPYVSGPPSVVINLDYSGKYSTKC